MSFTFTLESMQIDYGSLFGAMVGQVFFGGGFEITITETHALYSTVSVTKGEAMSRPFMILKSSPEKLRVRLVGNSELDLSRSAGFIEITEYDPDVTIGPVEGEPYLVAVNYRGIAFGEFDLGSAPNEMLKVFIYVRALQAALRNPIDDVGLVMRSGPTRTGPWTPVNVSGGELRTRFGSLFLASTNGLHVRSHVVEFTDTFAIKALKHGDLNYPDRHVGLMLHPYRQYDYRLTNRGTFERVDPSGHGVTHIVFYSIEGDDVISIRPIEQPEMGTTERSLCMEPSNVGVTGRCGTNAVMITFDDSQVPHGVMPGSR